MLSKNFQLFEEHKNLSYSFLRIFIGIALLVRGLLFITDPAKVSTLAGSEQYLWMYSYIAIVNLVGGALLAVGLFTRIAALIQIPILFGAVFFVHLKQGLLASGQSLELSVMVLFVLINIFLIRSRWIKF